MSGEREYSIVLKFPSADALMTHLAEYGDMLLQKEMPHWQATNFWLEQPTATPIEPPAPAPRAKNPNDRRGRHTAIYHELARAMKAGQPEMSYRDCYRAVCKAAPAAATEE